MTKASKSTIEAELDKAATALLKSAYGDMIDLPEGEEAPKRQEVDPKVFNAIVGWIRVKNKLEPDDDEESGLDKLAKRMGKTK